MIWILASLCLASGVYGQIADDFNCTVYDTTVSKFVYTEKAINCIDILGTSTCNTLFQKVIATPVYITAGGTEVRPTKCYSRAPATPFTFDASMNSLAKENCAKTCGYCCISTPFACPNAQFPRLNCATIQNSQCRDARWRQIIAEDCPAACGFCNEGGCVDAIVECANDRSICNAIGMQDFVNTNCRRTCGRCSTTTTVSSASGTCSSYIRDSSSACAQWSANGFCSNTFYTVAHRRQYCATTCRIC